MATDYEIIDNFLPSEIYKELHDILLPVNHPIPLMEHLPWMYSDAISSTEGEEDKMLIAFIHMIYAHQPVSPLLEKLLPHIEKLNIKALIRIKCNLYPNTETQKEHGMHTDFEFPHKAAILSINTCNGYTKLEDGTKIASVGNRLLLFDASTPHCSSTTTDQAVRVNINLNYF